MAKKMSKATKRRIILLGIPALLIIGYFVVTAITYTYSIIKLQHEEAELNEQLTLLKTNEQDLKIELQKLKNPEYIARYARENYLYSKNGEYIIKIEKNDVVKEPKTLIENNGYLYIIGGASLFVILVTYIIVKKKKTKKKKTK